MDSIKSQKHKAYRKRDSLIHNILVHLLTTLTCVFLCSYGFWLPQLISSAETFAFVLRPQWKPFLTNTKTLFLVVNLIVIILVRDSGFRCAAKCSSSSPVADLYDEYVQWSKRLRAIHVNGVEESNIKEETAQEVWLELAKDKGERKSGRGIEFKELPAEEPTKSAEEDLHEPKSDEGGESDELQTEELTRSAQEDSLGPESDEGRKSNELPPEELTGSAPDRKDLGDTKSDEGGKSDELWREELTRRADEFITKVNRRRWLESCQDHS